MIIAWDIETCPQSIASLSPSHRERYEKELKRQMEKDEDMSEEEASRLVRSVHPFLGWICCISVVRYDAEQRELGVPKSYTAASPTEEWDLLDDFWADVNKMPNGSTWVTFNGKRFDVPFVRARTLANKLQPRRLDLMKTHRYRHRPHADLACIFEYVSLSDVCELLDIDSPKGDMDGGGVYEAVQDGRIDDVAKYCEGDVIATLQCYLKTEPCLI